MSHNKLILFTLVLLFSLTFVLAWSTTTFNNSLTQENLTFTKNENITRYLAIPSGINSNSEKRRGKTAKNKKIILQ